MGRESPNLGLISTDPGLFSQAVALLHPTASREATNIKRLRSSKASSAAWARLSPRDRFLCSDMWRVYVEVVRARAGHAVPMLDRFHIVAKLNQALDDVRSAEVKRVKNAGCEPTLKRSRWVLLKNSWKLAELQSSELGDPLCGSAL